MPNEVYLVTSGDLRLAANQTCWPAQQDLETRLTAAFQKEGTTLRTSLPRRRDRRPRLHLLPAHGHGRLPAHPARRPSRLRHRRLAILPPRPPRPPHPSGPHPHHRQLVRPVARPRRPPQPQRLPRQSRRLLLLPLEQGLHRLPSSPEGIAEWLKTGTIAHDTHPRPHPGPRQTPRRSRHPRQTTSRRPPSTAKPSSASSTRAAWACTTPSSTTNSSTPQASTRSA